MASTPASASASTSASVRVASNRRQKPANPGYISPSSSIGPVKRIRGPGLAPASTTERYPATSRSWPPRSSTVVTPAARKSSGCHLSGVCTCTCMSTSPGVRNLSRAGMTVAPGGTVVVLARPTLVTRLPSTMTVAASPGGRPLPSISVAPTSAIIGFLVLSIRSVFSVSCRHDLRSYQQGYPHPCITGRLGIDGLGYRYPVDSSPGGRDVADHSEHRLRFNGLGGRDTGEPNDELAPAPGPFTECFDPATVQLHQPAHQRESNTEPPLRAIEPALTL